MNHLNEEELIAYRDGEGKGRAEMSAHLEECPECREELARIEAVFAALDAGAGSGSGLRAASVAATGAAIAGEMGGVVGRII